MSAFFQALLMDDPAAVMPGVPTCVPDIYYSCGPTNDPYWNNVVLQLHGDGTNGATSATDSSLSARISSRTGSAQISTAQFKFGTASLQSPNNFVGHYFRFPMAITMAAGEPLTIEFWFRPDSIPGPIKNILGSDFDVSNGWYIRQSSATLTAKIGGSSLSVGSAFTANTWHHIALSIGPAGYFVCINGVVAASDSSTHGAKTFVTVDVLGAVLSWGATESFAGYIDDLRITKGIARYTGNFNIPTAAFPDALETVWSPTAPRTVLSLHFDATTPFVDSSCAQPKTVTVVGNIANFPLFSTVEKKFGAGSVVFPVNDGTSRPASVIVTDHQDFDFGTGDFCFDCWAYRTSNTYTGTLFYYSETAAFSFTVNTSGTVIMNYRSSGGTQASINTGLTFPLNTWQYVVVQRRGTNFEVFLNGAAPFTTTITGGAGSTVNSAGDLFIGSTNANSNQRWDGYIDEFRVTKGAARYTTSFTPPTLLNCNSTTASVTNVVNGTETLLGMSATMSPGTTASLNPFAVLGGQEATGTVGTISAGNSNVSVALTGISGFTAIGTATSPAYPNISSTGTSGKFVRGNGGATPRVLVGFLNDGRITETYFDVDYPSTEGSWIDRTQTNYSIPDISSQYQAIFTPFVANVPLSVSTSPGNLGGVGFFILVSLPADRLNATAEFQVTVAPTTNNPRYGEAYYFGFNNFKFSIDR